MSTDPNRDYLKDSVIEIGKKIHQPKENRMR
jgi:hypothetical protein